MKSYTDLEQSKELAKILSIKSADMCINSTNPYALFTEVKPLKGFDEVHDPCWSLAALLSVLPKSVRLVGSSKESYWYCECVGSMGEWCGGFESADNPVDACYKMIIKLKEKNLL